MNSGIMQNIPAIKKRHATVLLAAALLSLYVTTAPARAAIMSAAPPYPALKPVVTDQSDVSFRGDLLPPLPATKPASIAGEPGIFLPGSSVAPPRPRHKPVHDTAAEPLSAADSELYKEIFTSQSEGEWDTADQLMKRLKDLRLRGHVLYQRYMHPASSRASFGDLSAWMDMYSDHPDAKRIYRLAIARKPSGSSLTVHQPAERDNAIGGFMGVLLDRAPAYRPAAKRTTQQAKAVDTLNRQIRSSITRGQPGEALKQMKESSAFKYLDAAEQDQLQAQIAAGYMYTGDISRAREISLAAARRSGKNAPNAGWIGGLSSWRSNDYKTAAAMFALTAESPYSSPWMQSAAAYWASRAHTRTGKIREVNKWLERAAAQPRTFYGLIATRALGWDFDFNWDMPELTQDHIKRLQKIPAARRAMALVETGQYHLAEAEMRQIDPGKDESLLEALLAYANRNALPSYAMRLAESTPGPDGSLYDAALYPLSPWSPNGGYKVDRALIYALIRQESRFNPAAVSHSGAAGLMQLMPATASYVSKSRDFHGAAGRHNLKDPQTNLDIGQSYVASLLDEDHVSTELFSLVIAYNAGPGNLRKWKDSLAALEGDPLLFIESIPVGETRDFVERVMSNYWIYRLRMDQPTPSLDAVAEGRWAEYVQLDNIEQARAEEIPAANGRQHRIN